MYLAVAIYFRIPFDNLLFKPSSDNVVHKLQAPVDPDFVNTDDESKIPLKTLCLVLRWWNEPSVHN